MQANERETLTLAEAFGRLGVGKTLGYQLVRDGRLPVLKLTARKVVVTRAALDALLAEGLASATPA